MPEMAVRMAVIHRRMLATVSSGKPSGRTPKSNRSESSRKMNPVNIIMVKVFTLPHMLAGMTTPWLDATRRMELTPNSRNRMMNRIQTLQYPFEMRAR